MKRVKANKIMAMFLSMALVVSSMLSPSLTTEAAAKKTTSITLSVKSSLTMYTGGSQTIKVKSVKPKGASTKVSFQSSNPDVVKVTGKGKITAADAGKAVITVTSTSNKKVSKKVKITVKDLVKKVTEDQAVISLDKKKTLKLSTNVKASDLKFKSSKSSVASVSSKGIVTGKKAGTAKITVTGKKGAAKGAKQVITVYVAKKSVKSVSLNIKEKTVKPGESFALKATVNPKDASKAVVFTSSNEKVATVNAKGTVKAVKAGTAKITVATVDGNKKAVCTVKVETPAPTKVPTKVPTKAPTAEPTATIAPAEPTATTAPAEPTVTTAPAEPTATTAPAEPTATTAPAEPTATTAPAEPTATTAPAEPTATTAPAEPTATTAPAEPTVTTAPVKPTATTAPAEPTPTPSGDYVYTFPKNATSYTIEKKGADYVVVVSNDDLTSDIETGKTELQSKPLTNSVFMEKWNVLSKTKLLEKSEILSSNRTLLKNFEIADGEGNAKTITVTKDGKKKVAVVTPNDEFTEVTIQVTEGASKKTITVSDIVVTGTEDSYEITGKIAGLMSNTIDVKAVLKKDGTSLILQKKTAGNYNTVLTYEETASAYEVRVNKIYAGELCDAMSVGNVFESITVTTAE